MAIPLCSKAAVDNIRLDVHTLNDLAVALRKGLRKHFANVHVEITECPNLTEKPFGLSRKGLGRKACVVQCGDPGYVIPDTMTEKVYSFTDVAKVAGLSNGLIIGCGAGPWQALNYLSEMIADIDVSEDGVKSFTKNVYTEDNEKKTFKLVKTGPDEDRFSALGNLYCSDGSSAQVLKVQCGKRIGYQSLSAAIRDSLNEEFKDPIALGVVFNTIEGTIKHHIAPGFAKNVTNVLDWLNLIYIDAPMVSVGTIITRNPEGYFLNNEHFHSYTADQTLGGHYHHDTTPETVKYEVYIAPAETLIVMDKAENPKSLFN